MAWVYLLIAGLLEIVWAYFMKQSYGFTRLWPSVATLGYMSVSFALLALAMRSLPMGTAYVVWTGIGAVGAFIVGVVFLQEHLSPVRVVAALLVVAGLVLFRLAPDGTTPAGLVRTSPLEQAAHGAPPAAETEGKV